MSNILLDFGNILLEIGNILLDQFSNIDIDIAARWKTNIGIDIGNINILLQYIAQQYIDLYPCPAYYFSLWNPF